MILLPSADQETEEATEAAADSAEEVSAGDEARQSLLDAIGDELGDSLVASHLEPGVDLWLRVSTEAWSETADYLRERQRFRYFEWLSAIDWLPSPFGRSLEATVDNVDAAPASGDESEDDGEDDSAGISGEDSGLTGTGADGITGGDTRFQVFARVYNLSTGLGLTIKADVGDDLAIGSWIGTYAGAAWHERETHEMFGITFTGNPDMRNLYLPGEFEGYPLRKDFPLLARLIKPWPGIVDVEPMPAEPEAASDSSAAAPTEGGDA